MDHGENRRGFFASRANLVLLVFLGVGGFYLVSEHWAHLLGAGPLVLRGAEQAGAGPLVLPALQRRGS